MQRTITGFHQDQEHHWVAELSCGHGQHMRHDPPWMERPWVLTEEGRASRLGQPLPCARCRDLVDEITPLLLAECRRVLTEAYESGGVSGLCAEGRWDLALDALRGVRLSL